MKKKLVQMITMTMVLFLAATVAHATPPGSGGGGEAAPIDGGISLLLAAGASYGVNKLYKNKKK